VNFLVAIVLKASITLYHDFLIFLSHPLPPRSPKLCPFRSSHSRFHLYRSTRDASAASRHRVHVGSKQFITNDLAEEERRTGGGMMMNHARESEASGGRSVCESEESSDTAVEEGRWSSATGAASVSRVDSFGEAIKKLSVIQN
jgi:hypothetical protein